MEIVQVLAVDQKHQHVETLAAEVETHLHPVHLCELEELCTSEGSHQTSLLLGLWLLLVKFIFHPSFQHFLIADSRFDWVSSGTPLFPPA